MKILVMSDSHSGLSFMRNAIKAVKPDMLIHLGDHYGDAETISFENPHIPMCQVPGNCDAYSCFGKPELMCLTIGGVMTFMTHGHKYGVKGSLARLLFAAREYGAQLVLYGHTHVADCHREEDGVWVVNPGSCGSYSGSVAVVEIADGQVCDCRILTAGAFTW